MTRRLDRSSRRSSRGWIAAALLVLTAAGGVAARVVRDSGVAQSAQSAQTAPTPLQFASPAGGSVQFSGRLDRGSVLAGGDGLVKMELVLRADARPGLSAPRLPTDVVVVLDRSGSMQGEALARAKSAIDELVAGLSGEDRFALVSYASDSRVDVSLAPATGVARQVWSETLAGIAAEGGTDMAAGLDLGIAALEGANTRGRSPRLILLSDGHANQGDHSPEGLTRRASRAVASEFVLTTVGVGLGFDEQLMGQLADAGTGNFYYVDRSTDLAQVFSSEFDSARETVAEALSVRVTPAPGVELIEAAGYPLETHGRVQQFRPGSLFAGQERRIWLTLRASDDQSGGLGGSREPGELTLGRFDLAYRDAGAAGQDHLLTFTETPRVARVAAEKDFYAAIDADVFEEGLASEGVNKLKQSISKKVRDGDAAGARSDIEAFQRSNRTVYQKLGRSADDSAALKEASELEDRVAAALAPSAPPEASKHLGKKLEADGRDGRRLGAKKK